MAELTKLGRYELRRVLGKGAMGVVYEGYDPTLSRRVAVKTILKSFGLDAETEAAYAARFVQEAKAVARLNHPNIVQVYDFSVESEVAYLVMEFIEGRELRSHFSDGERFEPAEVVRVMGELLDALDFAHEHGVIHRDVKPANVMLDAQRRVKLADFGVARIQDSERSAAGTMVGTPAFMSPEQISGGKIDRRTDIFSAGTILYQLLTGEQPFRGDGAWTVARQIMQDDPPTPSSVVRSVSPAFDAIVNKALAKKPSERYANAKEFSNALRGALTPGAQAPASVAPKPKARLEAKAGEAEIEFWRALQNSTDAAEFEFYLEQFPEGTYAQLARHKIAKLKEPAEAARKAAEEQARKAAEAKEQSRRETEERARAEAAARAKKEAEDLTRREAEGKAGREAVEAEAKARREAAEKAKREADEKARQAQALAKLKAQEQARAKAAVDEDATVAIGRTAEAPAPSRDVKRSFVVPTAVSAVVVTVGVAAYLISSRTPAPPAPVAQALAPAAPVIDVEKVRREAEERVRREYADKSAAERAAAAKLAAEKAIQEKQSAARVAAEKAAAEKAAEASRKAAEKVASAKSAQERAALERAAAEKAAAERAAAEKAAAEKVAAEQAAAVKAAADRAAAAKAAATKAPPVTVAAAAPAAAPDAAPPREGMFPGRYEFLLARPSPGPWQECDDLGIKEDIEIRSVSSESISGRDFSNLRFQNMSDGSVAATFWARGRTGAKLAGRATSIGYAGTYVWPGRISPTLCHGKWTLVRKGN